MTKKDWENIKIDSFKEYIIVYQTSRGKFSGKQPALYFDVNIPKYSMKFLDWLEVSDSRKYHYRRIKEIRSYYYGV